MLTNDDIIVRRTNYACCALDYLAAFVEADNFGTKECARKNRRLWLYMLFAKKVMDATPLEGETGKCGTLAFATKVAKKADCFCSSCDCENDPYPPPPDPCAIPVTYNVKAAVDADQQDAIEIAGPAVGDAYYISTETSSIGWLINTIQIWNGAGWDVVIPNDGDVTLTQAGVYWTALGGTNLPGLLFPTITAVWQGYPFGYAVQTNFPQISQYAGRPITIEVLSPGGWFPVLAFPNESAIVSPVSINAQGYYIQDIRVVYNYATCPYISGAATIEPPIGCGVLSATITPEAVCGTGTFNINAFIGAADGFILGNVVATEIETGVIQTIPAVLGDNIIGPFSYLNSVSIVITNDRDSECNIAYGVFTHPIYPFDAIKVYEAVDANQEGASIPGASYLIVSNVDGVSNTWSTHIGDYWNGSAWVTPPDETYFRAEIAPSIDLSYWQVVGGVPIQVFQPIQFVYETTFGTWTALLGTLPPFMVEDGVNITVEYECFGTPVEIYSGPADAFNSTVFTPACSEEFITGWITYDLECPITIPAVITEETEPFAIGGLNNFVFYTPLQADGKIVCVGTFTLYDATPVPRVTRLNADGSLDTAYNTAIGTGPNAIPRMGALDLSGRTVVVGDFTEFNGNAGYPYAVRLLANGSIDTSFVVGSSFNSNIGKVLIQSDGKIILIGNFTSYDGVGANRIIRLNDDGSRDMSFTMGTGFNSFANGSGAAINTDGTILVSSGFGWTSYDGNVILADNITEKGIVRIKADGTFDSSLTLGTHFNNNIAFICIQTDGKILVTGAFTEYNGTPVPRFARLNPDGTLDAGFMAVVATGFSATTTAVLELPSGQILVGDGTDYQGIATNRLSRLNSDGSRDIFFNPGPGFNNTVNQVVLKTAGTVIACGGFSAYNGANNYRVTRVVL